MYTNLCTFYCMGRLVGGCAGGVCFCSTVWLGLCLLPKISLRYLQQEAAYICALASPYLKEVSVDLYRLAVIYSLAVAKITIMFLILYLVENFAVTLS